MFESIISMNPSLTPTHRQTIEFHNLPQVRLCWKKGLQYLPSFRSHSERSILVWVIYQHQSDLLSTPIRYVISVNQKKKLNLVGNHFHDFCEIRYFPSLIDLSLTITIFHHGRRFFQKKIPFSLTGSIIDKEIKETITQNIPQNKIQSVHIHFELNSKTNLSLSPLSILLGERTRYQSEWQRMLEHPRRTHDTWYQFLGWITDNFILYNISIADKWRCWFTEKLVL